MYRSSQVRFMHVHIIVHSRNAFRLGDSISKTNIGSLIRSPGYSVCWLSRQYMLRQLVPRYIAPFGCPIFTHWPYIVVSIYNAYNHRSPGSGAFRWRAAYCRPGMGLDHSISLLYGIDVTREEGCLITGASMFLGLDVAFHPHGVRTVRWTWPLPVGLMSDASSFWPSPPMVSAALLCRDGCTSYIQFPISLLYLTFLHRVLFFQVPYHRRTPLLFMRFLGMESPIVF